MVGTPWTGAVATFTDPGGAEPNDGSHYSACIDWGDGSPTTAGTISFNGGAFTVSGTHTYAAPIAYTITTTLSHGSAPSIPVQSLAKIAGLATHVQSGQAQNAAFWHITGQTLIQSFNGGAAATQLANWLARSFPNLYGVNAGSHNLTGMSNAQVAAFYQNVYNQPLPNLDVEVLATALNIYATTLSLGGTIGQSYGFVVDAYGLGAYAYSVFNEGAPFSVPNYTIVSVYQLLLDANNSASGGEPWGSQTLARGQALIVFIALNETHLTF
jgi:hypothetical protein